MPSRLHPRKLLVEGDKDKRVIPFLMEANGVEWEPDGRHVVHIEPINGIHELLKDGVIESELRASSLQALGIVIDADGDAGNRWLQIKNRCRDQFDALPDQIPENGLEVDHPNGPRFGIWIMPDNRFRGMLEDFLIQLIPDESHPLYDFAVACVSEAARRGAPFKSVHTRKAEIHTWLAWQDEPGKQLHEGVHHRVLDPTKPESLPFVNWFRHLFRV